MTGEKSGQAGYGGSGPQKEPTAKVPTSAPRDIPTPAAGEKGRPSGMSEEEALLNAREEQERRDEAQRKAAKELADEKPPKEDKKLVSLRKKLADAEQDVAEARAELAAAEAELEEEERTDLTPSELSERDRAARKAEAAKARGTL